MNVEVYQLPKNSYPLSGPMFNEEEKNSEYLWEAPVDWIKSTGNSMRIGSFSLPDKKSHQNEFADLSIILLNDDGGGLVENINRWREQLGLGPLEDDKIKPAVKTINTKIGKGQFIFLQNPATKQGMLITIITHNNQSLFVKATGPLTTLKYQQEKFLAFSEGIYAN